MDKNDISKILKANNIQFAETDKTIVIGNSSKVLYYRGYQERDYDRRVNSFLSLVRNPVEANLTNFIHTVFGVSKIDNEKTSSILKLADIYGDILKTSSISDSYNKFKHYAGELLVGTKLGAAKVLDDVKNEVTKTKLTSLKGK